MGLGLGPASLHTEKKNLVICRISKYGLGDSNLFLGGGIRVKV